MRKTVHFCRENASCHINLTVSHFYFILFVPKSQYLDNNYYVFNKFFPLLPKTAYKRSIFYHISELYNMSKRGKYDKTVFKLERYRHFLPQTTNRNRHSTRLLQQITNRRDKFCLHKKSRGLKTSAFMLFTRFPDRKPAFLP